ncbi:uncharacterized protein BDR25DRAFT_374211 [Lindgomyces ingoldianus]|uniref:Uncharacterized protein n=1 Tax=Lindgomyces ingoldianus TaxID=673940 RepID=A0ACB6QLX3_9PLEO|nr:uncharacterized protein BDR25DRAFT_374211 [Lindgomyces ingoldianus]KAF2467911.1 hypothetical protein BDR25DRAFT_374211 [Lindgomyces ingoldianus]
MPPRLDNAFISSLAETGKAACPRFPWYRGAIVALGALNYPEEIPAFYTYVLEHYIPEDARKEETKKILEGLTKASGIVGAAKTGNAVRALNPTIPTHLKDNTCYRQSETFENASKRGREFHRQIYGRNPFFADSQTKNAAADYYWIVSSKPTSGNPVLWSNLQGLMLIELFARADLFYGYIFSFDEILDGLETSHCILSALLGIDCQEQVRNHMIGMLLNGAKREEIEAFRNVVLRLAEKLEVKFKDAPIPIPANPEGTNML